MEFTPLDNPAPELVRLKSILVVDEVPHYKSWMDDNMNFVLMVAAVAPEAEDVVPFIRAEYVFRHWGGR